MQKTEEFGAVLLADFSHVNRAESAKTYMHIA